MSRADKHREASSTSSVQQQKQTKQPKQPLMQRIKEMKTGYKVAALVVIILLLAVIIVGAVVWNYMNRVVDEMHEPIQENYDLSLVGVDGYINILLLGVDSRNMDNIKGTRSDMIMIASINEETNDVTLTSVYRDTYLKLGDTATYDKITHACVYGGPEMTMKSLNQALDIDLSQYVIVNFKTVADVVDAVGGITVDVQQYEINQLNKYTRQTARNIGKKDYNLVKAPGVQTLEGVQAVSYGRIRKGTGDDIKRTERMRTVVSLVFQKVKTMPFSDVKKIIDMAVPQVKTNLQMNDILALGFRLPKYNFASGSGWPYKWTSGYIKGVSYVFPGGSLINNTTEFHKEVFGQEDYTTSLTVNTISNEINNRIQAAKAAKELDKIKEGETKKDEPAAEPTDPDNPDGVDDPDDPDYNPGTDPSNPTEPTEPTTPTEPTVPTEPTEPTVPTEPTTPTTPGATEPTEPTVPSTPSGQTAGSPGGTSVQGT